MDKNNTATKENMDTSTFISQLKKSKKVKDVKITNNHKDKDITAIGGVFTLNDDFINFFYSESISFTAINVRALYRLDNSRKSDELALVRAINKYNEASFGIKACLLNSDMESFDVELNVESVLNPGVNNKLPIEPMLMILARSRNEIDTYVEQYLMKNSEVQ